MIDYLKSHMGQIIIATALLLVGLILGLICKQNANGIYISANYPGGKPIFMVGNSKVNIAKVDLNSLSRDDSVILAEKISTLDVKQKLSLKLRDMAKSSFGPFASIPVVLTLHFSNEQVITGPVAQTCKNSPIYGNSLVAYEATGNQNSIIKSKGIMGFNASREKLSTDCDALENGTYPVWLSKEHVEQWLGPVDPQQTNISIKAYIVVSSINI